jgi:hypothetical protein
MEISLPILVDEKNPLSDNLTYPVEIWENVGLISLKADNKEFHFTNEILYLLYKASQKEQKKYLRELKMERLT